MNSAELILLDMYGIILCMGFNPENYFDIEDLAGYTKKIYIDPWRIELEDILLERIEEYLLVKE